MDASDKLYSSMTFLCIVGVFIVFIIIHHPCRPDQWARRPVGLHSHHSYRPHLVLGPVIISNFLCNKPQFLPVYVFTSYLPHRRRCTTVWPPLIYIVPFLITESTYIYRYISHFFLPPISVKLFNSSCFPPAILGLCPYSHFIGYHHTFTPHICNTVNSNTLSDNIFHHHIDTNLLSPSHLNLPTNVNLRTKYLTKRFHKTTFRPIYTTKCCTYVKIKK